MAWARYAGLLTDGEARYLLDKGGRRQEDAASVYGRAIELRETIYRVLSAFGRRELPSPGDLDALRHAHIAALDRARLVAVGDQARWAWSDEDDALDRMLWPIARSAVELATSEDLARVKECPGATGPCTWLFVDASKPGRRRWCSMAECGSVSKARRQTTRRRVARAQRTS